MTSDRSERDRDDRELFNEWMVDTPNRTALRIQAEGNSPVPPRLMGRYFHGAMSNEIAHLDSAGGSQNKAPEEERLSRWFNCVHKFLKDNFKVSLLPAIKEVPLRGFMYPKDEDFLPDLNYWNGRADAIGLLEGEDDYKYVIVKWKTAATTLNAFWKNKRSGDSFTQCFVYTRLLKLHLSLDYYPPILIVPFNSEREYMHPRLFTDYPDQFKEAIEKYQWSTNPPQRFKKESPLKDKVKEGRDWFSVLSILESLLITVRSSNAKVKKAYLKSDEAGCYHNSQVIVAARDVGERVGVSLQRYDFSEPQSGKDVCDRILCPLKGAIRRYCNEGHDVLTASDMHKALKERPVQGCTASVCHVNETKKGIDIKKLQQFSAMHDFSYQQDGLRVWKAFQVGPGKLITWDEIYIKHQGATDLITEQENFGFIPRVTHGSAHDNGDAESSSELGLVLECPEPACARTFRSVEEMQLHLSVGQHTESMYDKLKRG
ncbi:hypothetical protein P5673_006904 [Acropora cervicornis]|uniref:C2H2-type domain-containing protein n=1 Tax=Acropora cervicornis TaxID=6130 RepID=A0AAD9QXC0_ACRCE|nr:hypothetical protein P5673_006904 [Acropora cervicornis]